MNTFSTEGRDQRSEATGDRPDIESFHHLARADLGQCACGGLACFVARHLDPRRWQDACTQEPPVYCLGKCFEAPAHGSTDSRPRVHVDAGQAVVLERIASGGARSLARYRRTGGYRTLQTALKQPPASVINAVEASGLRGRGGAAFPTGRKWRMAAHEAATPRYVVANADEGDPGAYIDRFIMEDDPHCLIEAMAIAAYAIGAQAGWVYLRREYPHANTILQSAIDEAREDGFLGVNIVGSGFSFDIAIQVGRGSYACGEETAMLNAIEGRRPVAMARPPFPTQVGLFGKPTLVNNVETLASIPWILRHGADAYHRLGITGSRGTKVVSLNSLFKRPGLYEVEFGVPVRHIVEDLGGGLKTGELTGVMIGGPLAGVIPPRLLDTPFAFEELRHISAGVGHGGVIAFDRQTSIPELIHHVFQFAAGESCGKCPPCRLGCRRVEQVFQAIVHGTPATAATRRQLIDILVALKLTSLCGLGSGAAEFADSVLLHYAPELEPCFT
jgi:NADH:ubiquinone oxidoreductase subunit F (NADH-binding)